MRVSYCYAVRDQNRLVYQADEEFVAGLPAELQGPMQRWFDRFKMGLDDAMDMFKNFHADIIRSDGSRSSLRPPICTGARTRP